jgi:Ca-activated chloride channel homolog
MTASPNDRPRLSPDIRRALSGRMIRHVLGILLGIAVSGIALEGKAEIRSCVEDAMIVFDASGSMAGNEKLGIATTITRIDEVRGALEKVLPSVTAVRRVGLITYGPGAYNQCNVKLNLRPTSHAGELIMREVEKLNPAGKTPLSEAVEQAANVLDYRQAPGTVIVVTDGEETCGGSPCDLGSRLHETGQQLTVHVVAYRAAGFAWTGEQSILQARCLAEATGGLYVTADTQDELVSAFEEVLGCPAIAQRPSKTAPGLSEIAATRGGEEGALAESSAPPSRLSLSGIAGNTAHHEPSPSGQHEFAPRVTPIRIEIVAGVCDSGLPCADCGRAVERSRNNGHTRGAGRVSVRRECQQRHHGAD